MMISDDKQVLERALHESFRAVEAAAAVPDEWARRRPAEEEWSVLECLEHIALVNDALGSRIRGAEVAAEPVVNAGREQQLWAGVISRANRVKSPAAAAPTGRFESVPDALQALRGSFDRLESLLAEKEGVLRHIGVQHRLLGVISGYEAFWILAAHAERHAQQIREARAVVAGG